jgi:5-methylcytosine-specific restriction enzyme subunit McrC
MPHGCVTFWSLSPAGHDTTAINMLTVIAHESGLINLPALVDRHNLIDQLLRYSAGAPFPCFRLKRGALYAGEVVGTLQIGKLRLTILPRSSSNDAERDKEFLLNLLRSAGYLGPRSLTAAASVRTSALDPLEAILTEIGRELLSLVQKGIPRRYEEVRAESAVLRGRVDFGRLCRRLPGGEVKLPIRYTPLSNINALTRTACWVAESLMSMARSASSRHVLAEVLLHLEPVIGHRPTRGDILDLSLSRYEKSWDRIAGIAQLLLDGKFIDPTFAGRADAFGMIFPLQHLFERTMRRLLADSGRMLGLSVTHRSASFYMLSDPSGAGLLRLKPDYVFLKESKPVMLGDAKWKSLDKNARAFGVDRADIYQMNAYLTRYQISQGAIFVPKLQWMEKGWHRIFVVPVVGRNLHLVSVDIERLVSHVRSIRSQAEKDLREVLAVVTLPLADERGPVAGNQSEFPGAQLLLGI